MTYQDKTIKEIKDLLAQNPSDNLLAELANDSRAGVQKLVQSYTKKLAAAAQKQAAFDQRFEIERTYWAKGQIVAGLDEVGRGPLAGPIVVAAVILPQDFNVVGVNDSKKLSAKKREEYAELIKAKAISYAIVEKSPAVIDQVNISRADELAMREAVGLLTVKPDCLLVDQIAHKLDVGIPEHELIKGDSRSNSIAAASIIAKVYRDQLMAQYAKQYPQYGFEKNAGYGTAEHLLALKEYGPCPIHRQSFAPVKDFLK